jgi:hypothetical protein
MIDGGLLVYVPLAQNERENSVAEWAGGLSGVDSSFQVRNSVSEIYMDRRQFKHYFFAGTEDEDVISAQLFSF